MTKKPPSRKAVSIGSLGILILLVVLALTGAAAFYYDPPPDPKKPACLDGEKRLFDDGWYCVIARKP